MAHCAGLLMASQTVIIRLQRILFGCIIDILTNNSTGRLDLWYAGGGGGAGAGAGAGGGGGGGDIRGC